MIGRIRARAFARLFPLLLVFAPGAAEAQETDTVKLGAPDTLAPVAADTFLLVDSILEPDDTVTVERELEDSLLVDRGPPLPRLIPLPIPRPLKQGFAEGVWEWDRAALLRSTGLTLADLLERVPSLTRVRAGYYMQPELVVSPTALSGDVELYIDGFPHDPLTGTTIDLSRIGITDLERVRVERRGGRLRVELTQLEHPAPRRDFESSPDSGSTYTRVEIATGDLDTDGLAGVFMAPRFLIGPVALAVSRLDSEGLGRVEPGRVSSAWLRWSHLHARWGVHAEYRRGSVDREPVAPFPGEQTRTDWTLRARARPWDPFTAELYGGHSEVDDQFIDDSVSTELSGTHYGLRTAYDSDRASTQASLRVRSSDLGPQLFGDLAAELRPLRWIAVNGEYRHEDWEGTTAASWIGGAMVGPFFGARAFVEVAGGEHGIAWLTRGDAAPVVERSHQRAGVDWVRGGWRAGGAVFRTEGDSVAPPAIPGIGESGSRTLALYPGFELQGFEATFRIPLIYDPVGLEGFYARLTAVADGAFAAFQPVEQARVAIIWYDLPLEGDQFEVELRLAGEYRGEMQAPSMDAPATLGTVEPMTRVDLDLNIRVLDIHAYVSWQNVLHNVELRDLPGGQLPGQTAYFGVKWEMWN